jgi:hypothetical protein
MHTLSDIRRLLPLLKETIKLYHGPKQWRQSEAGTSLMEVEASLHQRPHFAIIGRSSSGKSSLIGQFMGYSFSPVSRRLTTRQPLIFQPALGKADENTMSPDNITIRTPSMEIVLNAESGLPANKKSQEIIQGIMSTHEHRIPPSRIGRMIKEEEEREKEREREWKELRNLPASHRAIEAGEAIEDNRPRGGRPSSTSIASPAITAARLSECLGILSLGELSPEPLTISLPLTCFPHLSSSILAHYNMIDTAGIGDEAMRPYEDALRPTMQQAAALVVCANQSNSILPREVVSQVRAHLLAMQQRWWKKVPVAIVLTHWDETLQDWKAGNVSSSNVRVHCEDVEAGWRTALFSSSEPENATMMININDSAEMEEHVRFYWVNAEQRVEEGFGSRCSSWEAVRQGGEACLVCGVVKAAVASSLPPLTHCQGEPALLAWSTHLQSQPHRMLDRLMTLRSSLLHLLHGRLQDASHMQPWLGAMGDILDVLRGVEEQDERRRGSISSPWCSCHSSSLTAESLWAIGESALLASLDIKPLTLRVGGTVWWEGHVRSPGSLSQDWWQGRMLCWSTQADTLLLPLSEAATAGKQAILHAIWQELAPPSGSAHYAQAYGQDLRTLWEGWNGTTLSQIGVAKDAPPSIGVPLTDMLNYSSLSLLAVLIVPMITVGLPWPFTMLELSFASLPPMLQSLLSERTLLYAQPLALTLLGLSLTATTLGRQYIPTHDIKLAREGLEVWWNQSFASASSSSSSTAVAVSGPLPQQLVQASPRLQQQLSAAILTISRTMLTEEERVKWKNAASALEAYVPTDHHHYDDHDMTG